MSGTKLIPEKITSPFQLMAAWFSMLVLIVGVLLAGAVKIDRPDWASGYLVVFSSVVIVMVLACVTLMLTMFRPHLQEGKEYAEWLKDKGRYSAGIIEVSEVASRSVELKIDVEKELNAPGSKRRRSYSKESCLVSVADLSGATNIVEGLKNRGFNVELFKDASGRKEKLVDQSSIWIGLRMPPFIVLEAIKVALVAWPNLKYLQLSGDGSEPPDFVHDQLFLGGSTSTAVGRGLKSWSIEEINALNPSMSIKDFHDAIRKNY